MNMFRATRVLRDASLSKLDLSILIHRVNIIPGHEALYPRFWSQPLRYMRWAAREKPTFFWSTMLGLSGPLLLLVVPPIRKYYGYEDRPFIPQTYPSMSYFKSSSDHHTNKASISTSRTKANTRRLR